MKPLLFAFLALPLLTALAWGAETSPPADSTGAQAWTAHGFTSEQRESIHAALRWGVENKFVPGGALLIMHRGEPVFREGFGVADLETKKPFAADAPCRIASVTKPHTATLLALLVDEGRLSWDDPVDKHLPQFTGITVQGKGKAARTPTIRELLSHTAGFPGNDDRRGGDPGFKTGGTLAEAVDDLARAFPGHRARKGLCVHGPGLHGRRTRG